jgi:hypothetical protein
LHDLLHLLIGQEIELGQKWLVGIKILDVIGIGPHPFHYVLDDSEICLTVGRYSRVMGPLSL